MMAASVKGAHRALLSSTILRRYTEHLARCSSCGEFPGETGVLGMEGVNEKINWLSVI
jgi:hypothetical protein